MDSKLKKKRKNKTLDYIIAGAILAIIVFVVYWEFEKLKASINFSKFAAMSPWQILWAILGAVVLLIIFVGMYILMKKRPDMQKKVEDSVVILWRNLWVPGMVLVIMFLGWLHNKYQYESHFQENVTQSFCSLGNATMTIYNATNSLPGWVWILIWGSLFWSGIDSALDVWREKKKNEDEDEKKKKNKRKN